MASVEQLANELCKVLERLGLPVPLPAQGYIILERLDDMIAPARIPAPLRRLWEVIDLDRLAQTVEIYPQPSGPEGLGFWLGYGPEALPEDGLGPRHLINFGYTSHDAMWIEADSNGWAGGSMFESFISDPGFPYTLRYRSVEDWLETIVMLLQEGAFEPWGDGGISIDSDRERELSQARLAFGSHPILGEKLEVDIDPDEWPTEWRLLSEQIEELRASQPPVKRTRYTDPRPGAQKQMLSPWRPPFPLYSIPEPVWPLPPRWRMLHQFISKIRPPYPLKALPAGMSAGDLYAVTLYYGPTFATQVSVKTTVEPTYDVHQTALDSLFLALKFARCYGYDLYALPQDEQLRQDITRSIVSSEEQWLLEHEPRSALRFAALDAYAVIIQLADRTAIVSGTVPLPGRELVALTDFANYGLS